MKKAIVFVLLALIVLGGLSLIALIPQVEAQGWSCVVIFHDPYRGSSYYTCQGSDQQYSDPLRY